MVVISSLSGISSARQRDVRHALLSEIPSEFRDLGTLVTEYEHLRADAGSVSGIAVPDTTDASFDVGGAVSTHPWSVLCFERGWKLVEIGRGKTFEIRVISVEVSRERAGDSGRGQKQVEWIIDRPFLASDRVSTSSSYVSQ